MRQITILIRNAYLDEFYYLYKEEQGSNSQNSAHIQKKTGDCDGLLGCWQGSLSFPGS